MTLGGVRVMGAGLVVMMCVEEVNLFVQANLLLLKECYLFPINFDDLSL